MAGGEERKGVDGHIVRKCGKLYSKKAGMNIERATYTQMISGSGRRVIIEDERPNEQDREGRKGNAELEKQKKELMHETILLLFCSVVFCTKQILLLP